MKHACAAILISSAISLATMSPAGAWGDKGHEAIALAATAYLTPAAKQSVDTLLASDADTLTAGNIASRATWADRWRDSDRNAPPSLRYKQTREWHFTDIEIDQPDIDAACFNWPGLTEGQQASAGPAQACIVEKIEQFAYELADTKTPLPERQKALKFLLHLVGDLHQPLHAADHHDKGGNAVVVIKATGAQSNLHGYWDTAAVDSLGTSPDVIAAQIVITNKSTIDQIAAGTPRAWAAESNEVARVSVYDPLTNRLPDHDGKITYQLDAAYEQSAAAAVKVQLQKAAIRLALILNRSLP